jgi:hypothetical protein
VSTEAGTLARQMLSRAAQNLAGATRGVQRPLSHLEAVRHAEWLLSNAQALLIDAARAEGASWGEIARARGTTRQAERQAADRRARAAAVDPFDRWLAGQRLRWADDARRRTATRVANKTG